MTGAPDGGTPDTAELLAAAVLAVPGVVQLYGGTFGEIGTYLPGRRVPGIRQDEQGTQIHLVVGERTDVRAVAAAVHRAAATVVGPPVHVHVDDLAPTPTPSPEEF